MGLPVVHWEMMSKDPAGIFYVAVDDLAKYNCKIEQAGGKIHVEKQEVPGMGWLSLFTDAEGRMNGLFKPMMPAKKKAAKRKKK